MPLYLIRFKVKTQGMELEDSLLVPAKDAKKARACFQRLTAKYDGIKGQYQGEPILYDMSESTLEITGVELAPVKPKAREK